MILGIIPAGGKAKRFGGYPKEMLPYDNNNVLLDRTVTAMCFGGAGAYLVLTTKDKIAAHAGRLGAGYDFRISQDTLWKSLKISFGYKASWNLFAMPDTYYPQDIFDRPEMHQTDFNIGYFETIRPERFGVIQDGQIYDKYDFDSGNYMAWGALCWSEKVVRFWIDHISEIKNHTDAFNLAMKEYGYTLCRMDYYHDMASWGDYEKFVTGLEW